LSSPVSSNKKNVLDLSSLFSTPYSNLENSNIFKLIFKLQGQVAKELKRSNVTLRNQTLSPDPLFRELFFFSINDSHLIRQLFYHLKTNEMQKKYPRSQISNPLFFELNLNVENVPLILQKFKINNIGFSSSFQLQKESQYDYFKNLQLTFFQNVIEKENSIIKKIRRWAYHYSMIHRKTNYVLTSINKTLQFSNMSSNLIPNLRTNL